MINRYLLIALRNFRKNKVFSLINILGLSVGISAALMIFLVVQYDFSFDRFHKDSDRIYRAVTHFTFAGVPIDNSGVNAVLGPTARKEGTGIETVAPFHEYQANVTIAGGQLNNGLFEHQDNLIFADAGYFNIIQYKWIAGSPASLNEPFKTVLTESRAKAYFGDTKPQDLIGRVIYYDDSIKTQVSGIVSNFSQNSDFRKFEEFISLSTIPAVHSLTEYMNWNTWGNTNSSSQLMLKLAPGTKPAAVEKQLVALYKKYDEEKDPNSTCNFLLQPLSDIHFNSTYSNFSQRQAHKPTLYGLIAVATFLLLLGCINFINLATANASRRAKEIGVRKTMGSTKTQLHLQFFTETLLITLFSTILSLLLLPLLLQLFSDFIPEQVDFGMLGQANVWIFLVMLVLIVGLLAGSYPAMVLSRFKPVLVLKNQAYANTGKTRQAWLRKTLTVSQFVIAQFFILATLVVGKQIRFMLNQDMGFKKNAIVYFRVPYQRGEVSDVKNVLYQQLKSIPGIEKISMGQEPPSSGSTSSTSLKYQSGNRDIETHVQIKNGDSAYRSLYQIKLLAGRDLRQSDTTAEYLINETYAHVLGFENAADAVGITLGDDNLPVVGVVADFNTKSLHTKVAPVILRCQGNYQSTFHVALAGSGNNTDQWKATLASIEKAWKTTYPEQDFNYKFVDESIERFYQSEQKTASLLNWAAGLAIFISCLGLLGLVIYTTYTRTKEIGIRKVLGASIAQIVSLLSRDFLLLILIAYVLAAPLAWWAMHDWLKDFAYRTDLDITLFLLAGFLMLVAAMITLSFRTIRAASANPVKSLRTE